MFALIAAFCFLLAAFGLNVLGPIAMVPLGLTFLAIHLLFDVRPWRRA